MKTSALAPAVVLVAELDVLRGDRVAVVELDPLAQGEGGALGVRGHREVLGQGQMVVELGALVLDEGVVEGREEVVGRGGAVVLLGIQPARREAGVPRQDELALGRGPGRGRERDDRRRRWRSGARDGEQREARYAPRIGDASCTGLHSEIDRTAAASAVG